MRWEIVGNCTGGGTPTPGDGEPVQMNIDGIVFGEPPDNDNMLWAEVIEEIHQP